MFDINAVTTRAEIEEKEEWQRWSHEIPYIKFPDEWQVKIVPPFARAIVRFFILDESNPEDRISVYLDCYDNLGWVGKPYWEAYSIDGDTQRFLMQDTEGLINCIKNELERRKKCQLNTIQTSGTDHTRSSPQ